MAPQSGDEAESIVAFTPVVEKSSPKIIPTTALLSRYRSLSGKSLAQRLELAQIYLDQRQLLPREVNQTVDQFSSYENIDEPFFPLSRAAATPGPKIKRTNDLVLRLPKAGPLRPRGKSPEPRMGSARPLSGEDLDLTFVERELLVQRTTSPAQWDDGSPNVGGTRLDVLLREGDGTPVVGEVKLPGDKDLFYALMQALTCAAHLATQNQYLRLLRHFPDASFRDTGKDFRIDVVLLTYTGGAEPAGKLLPALSKATQDLVPSLLGHAACGRHIRRISAMDLRLAGNRVEAELSWAYEAA